MPLKGPLFDPTMQGPLMGEPYVFRTPADEARLKKAHADEARAVWLRENPEARQLAARLALEQTPAPGASQEAPEEEPERLALLPRYDDEEGLVAPEVVAALNKAGSLFGRAYRGDDVDPEDPANFAMTVAGGSMLARRPRGSVGMGGREATPPPAEAPAADLGPLLGRYPTTTAGRVVNMTRKGGGYSVNLPSGQEPTEGLMVGQYANADPRNTVISPLEGPMTRSHVSDFVDKNTKALSREDNYLGTWRDTDGTVYIDVSRRFDPADLRKAVKFGEQTAQKAIFDRGKFETIPTDISWEDFIKSPEFQLRMDEMAAKGRAYLQNHANKEWWDIHGSAFERVYGPQAIEQVAGLIAATAPTRDPRANLQVMSEYMRRLIKSEPLIQPDWRVPAGQMTRNEGTMLGMEKSQKGNVLRGAAGQPLSGYKVNAEQRALLGDPDAGVYDRHWARIGEDPSTNIFTGPGEGVIPNEAYPILDEQVRIGAQRAGRPLRDYSADVWTGIRDTIQKTSELFGNKYKGSAISGESKSYADHFVDLIKEKAEHLGISVEEMESRLRSGDATLLSIMLGTPLGAMAYKEWQQQQQQQQQPSASDQGGS